MFSAHCTPRRLTVTGLLSLPLLFACATSARAADKFEEKAAALLDKYVAATGGEAAYDAIKTRVTKGELSMPARGVTGTMVVYLCAPNKFYSEISTSMGNQRRGWNGKTVWMIEPAHGPRILKGLERTLVIRDSTLDRFGHWRELAQKVEFAGEEEVQGKKCAKVVLTYKPIDPEAKEAPVTIYLDLATGLIVQYTTEISRPQMLAKVTAILDDYKESDGILLAQKMTLKVDDFEYTVKVTSVTNNVEIPAEQFVLPREIQELIVKGEK